MNTQNKDVKPSEEKPFEPSKAFQKFLGESKLMAHRLEAQVKQSQQSGKESI